MLINEVGRADVGKTAESAPHTLVNGGNIRLGGYVKVSLSGSPRSWRGKAGQPLVFSSKPLHKGWHHIVEPPGCPPDLHCM